MSLFSSHCIPDKNLCLSTSCKTYPMFYCPFFPQATTQPSCLSTSINQSINQSIKYPFIVWYDTSNIPADNNAFGIYITYEQDCLSVCIGLFMSVYLSLCLSRGLCNNNLFSCNVNVM